MSPFRVYLFTSFTADIVLPIFGLFIPLLAAELGANAAEIGIVGGASYVTYSFVPFVVGRYSDRMKLRRGLVLASLVILTVITVLYYVVGTPLQLIAIRVAEGAGWSMLWPIIQAAIADEAQMETGRSLGVYNLVWSGASAASPLLGVVLIFAFQSVRTIFLVSAVLLFATVVVNLAPIVWDRRQTRRSGSGSSDGSAARSGDDDLLADSGRRAAADRPRAGVNALDGSALGIGRMVSTASYSAWFYIAALIFIMGVRGIVFTFALPLAQSTGVSVLLIGSFAFFFGASRFATYLFTIRDDFRAWFLSRERIRRNVMAMLLLASIGGVLPIIPDKSGLAFLVSFVLCGIAASGIAAISQAEMIGLNPGKRGENAGLLESSIGIGQGFGPIVAGQLAGGSLLLPFYLPATGAFVLIPALFLATRRRSAGR